MRSLGLLALIAGALVAGYALFIYDPTVAGYGSERINNIGRLSDRQNLLIAGCAGAVVGTLMLIFGPSASQGAEEVKSPEDEFRDSIEEGNLDAMRSMLRQGLVRADGEMERGRGWLQYAVTRDAAAQCEVLLEAGANPTHRDRLGASAIELASHRTSAEVLRVVKTWQAPAGSASVAGHPIAAEQDIASNAARLAESLQKLRALHASGVLTASEFETAKARLLST